MNHAGETKLLQANWRITLEIPDCLRQIDVLHWKCEIASGKLIFPAWFFNLPEAFCSRRWNRPFALGNWMSTEWFFCQPEAFSRIVYWRDISLEAMRSRRVDSSVCLRLFLYHVLERYISWSDGTSTNWICYLPKAFSCITYWRDTFLEVMEPRRVDLFVRLRLFLVSRIERIHVLKRWIVDDLILPSA